MATLNAGAARAMLAVGVRAATDVTGFGLLGHLHSLLRASRAAAHIDLAAVPFLPRVRELAERGAIPGGTRRNLESVESVVTFDAGVDDVAKLMLADAQTSGGLLIALPEAKAAALVSALQKEGTPAAAVIGRVVAGQAGTITVA
jgi:selenide,water dikinase